MSDLLTLDEAASRVRLHRTTLARAIERGELEASRLCGRWRIRPESIEEWITAGVPAPKSSPQRARLSVVPHAAASPQRAGADRFPLVRRKVG